jgi:hypothetical protein
VGCLVVNNAEKALGKGGGDLLHMKVDDRGFGNTRGEASSAAAIVERVCGNISG